MGHSPVSLAQRARFLEPLRPLLTYQNPPPDFWLRSHWKSRTAGFLDLHQIITKNLGPPPPGGRSTRATRPHIGRAASCIAVQYILRLHAASLSRLSIRARRANLVFATRSTFRPPRRPLNCLPSLRERHGGNRRDSQGSRRLADRGLSADLKRRLGEKQLGRRHQRSSSYRHPEWKQ
jgi:hypothetical protein